jgi:3-hydroxyisobutyrate dehydrogenase
MRIGFIGLGNMGLPMARRLVAGGYEVLARDTNDTVVTGFVEQAGAFRLTDGNLGEVDVLITMLPTSAIVESVVLDSGVADRLEPGALVVDMSSSEPTRSRELGLVLLDKGLRYLDAPVSGGVKGAEEGRLAIMAGGTEADVAEVSDIFAAMGRSTIHVGPIGAGHAAKALNNLVSAASVVATVEALRVAERFGIAGDRFVEVLNASSGRSNTSENKVRQFMLSKSFASGFPIGLMTKDIDIALQLAHTLEVNTELGESVAEIWHRVCEAGHAGQDHTRMYELA